MQLDELANLTLTSYNRERYKGSVTILSVKVHGRHSVSSRLCGVSRVDLEKVEAKVQPEQLQPMKSGMKRGERREIDALHPVTVI